MGIYHVKERLYIYSFHARKESCLRQRYNLQSLTLTLYFYKKYLLKSGICIFI